MKRQTTKAWQELGVAEVGGVGDAVAVVAVGQHPPPPAVEEVAGLPVDGVGDDVAAADVGAEVPDRDADPHPGGGGVTVPSGPAVAGCPGPGGVPRAGRRRVRGAAALMPARHRRSVSVLTRRAVGQHGLDAAGEGHRVVPGVVGLPGAGLLGRQTGDARRRGVISMARFRSVLVLPGGAFHRLVAARHLPGRVMAAGSGRSGDRVRRPRPAQIMRRHTTQMPSRRARRRRTRMTVLHRRVRTRRARLHPRAAMRRVGDEFVAADWAFVFGAARDLIARRVRDPLPSAAVGVPVVASVGVRVVFVCASGVAWTAARGVGGTVDRGAGSA